MKTKNNVQKAVLRTAAVIVSFVLISFTVSAQDFWKRLLINSSFNEIAIAMIETTGETELPENTNSGNTADFYFDAVYEPHLELENWMISDTYFSGIEIYSGIETESMLQLQDWMLNESNFNVNHESDNSLELEDWMISDEYWNM